VLFRSQRVLSSDLLVVLTHYPSFGAGMELGFAHDALLPILLIEHSDQRVSRMVTGIPSLVVELKYRDPDELYRDLRVRLRDLRPLLQERKMAFASGETNIVGPRLREIRTGLDLTRDELATSTGIALEALTAYEDLPDAESNPSLIHLRKLATALKTTAAELIAPGFTQMVVDEVMGWLDPRKAARFSQRAKPDQNRLVRRALLRVMDQLEQEDERLQLEANVEED
jgi:transcriptional regulator with XRE-family HTH domain